MDKQSIDCQCLIILNKKKGQKKNKNILKMAIRQKKKQSLNFYFITKGQKKNK